MNFLVSPHPTLSLSQSVHVLLKIWKISFWITANLLHDFEAYLIKELLQKCFNVVNFNLEINFRKKSWILNEESKLE